MDPRFFLHLLYILLFGKQTDKFIHISKRKTKRYEYIYVATVEIFEYVDTLADR
jgi:hypothetical protein